MLQKEIQAKTIEDALERARRELKLQDNEFEYEVLQKPKKGFLGFLGKQEARILIKYEPESEDKKVKRFCIKWLTRILDYFDSNIDINLKLKDKNIYCNLNGREISILIGKSGQTLYAIEHLLNLIIGQKFNSWKFNLDISRYKEKQKRKIISEAERIATKVIRTGRAFEMKPMSANKRKIIHTALKEKKGVCTYSKGQEPNRRVVIAPNNEYKRK